MVAGDGRVGPVFGVAAVTGMWFLPSSLSFMRSSQPAIFAASLQAGDFRRRRRRCLPVCLAGCRWSSRSARSMCASPLSFLLAAETITRRARSATAKPTTPASAVADHQPSPIRAGLFLFALLPGLAEPLPLFLPAICHQPRGSLVRETCEVDAPPRAAPRAATPAARQHRPRRRRPVERVEVDARERPRRAARSTAGPRRRRRARTRPARPRPAAGTPLRAGLGIEASQRSQIRFVCAKLATGITPAMIGTSIPVSRAAATKSK